jgi:1-acyl-sn-glycerol-3-phosphate acyltransferase
MSVPQEELDELRAAIGSLRREIEERWTRAPGSRWVDELSTRVGARAKEVDWGGLFGELRRRFAAFGVEPSDAEVDDFGLDSRALAQWGGVLDFLHDRWWRIETAGTERIPSDERVMFVANRGGILPYDGLMIAHAVERARGREARPRFLVADWLFTAPFAAQVLTRLGGVRACAENAERLLRSDRSVIAFPEGQKGALKPYRERYRLQRFARGGFVSIALRERATIVPVAVVGAEEIHPILFQSSFADRLAGLPLPLTPTFPWLGPLGLVPLPSRWRIRFGRPIRLHEVPVERADDPLFVTRTRELVRGNVQSLLEHEVRGRSSIF